MVEWNHAVPMIWFLNDNFEGLPPRDNRDSSRHFSPGSVYTYTEQYSVFAFDPVQNTYVYTDNIVILMF